MDCLIGYTGFVGSNLCRQRSYDELINSKNFRSMAGKHYNRLVCAGVSAVKWKANKDPETDLRHIDELIEILKTVSADKMILISTIDVYPVNRNADEDTDCHNPNHHAYGRHRLYFEDFCRSHFSNMLCVRLPGLFGVGIKKNVIFDLLNHNCLDMINPSSCFQYYDLNNLSEDIELAEMRNIKLLNLFTEPVATKEILQQFFPDVTVGENAVAPVSYDLNTKYASLRNHSGKYLYTKQEIMAQLAEFIRGYQNV